MIETVIQHPFQLVAAHPLTLLFLLLFVYLLKNKFNHGLHKYPGPILASLTDWWRFYDVLKRRTERTHIELHQKHGDIVRLGPNLLSFANPEALKDIYSLKKNFAKSNFYPVQSNLTKNGPSVSIFNTIDPAFHARFRRCTNNAYAMSTLVHYEPFVDDTTTVFFQKTEENFVETGEVCDFSHWLQFYAADVIGQITFSKRFGFVDTNTDVENILNAVSDQLDYASTVGQQPWLDQTLLKKNPIKMYLLKFGLLKNPSPISTFAINRVGERKDDIEAFRRGDTNIEKNIAQHGRADFIARFAQSIQDHPEFMNYTRLMSGAITLIFAGSDSTGASLSALFYYLLRNPLCYNKLVAEIDEAVSIGTIDLQEDCLVTWSAAQKLPYLDACIQEAFRLFPAVGLLLERVVPAGGATIAGEFIPEGTLVGSNAWVIHRRKEIFGDDVEAFRPERWLGASPEKLKEMKGCMLHFGMGTRTCIGKNISILEMYKLVPGFLRRFHVEFADPSKEWRLRNAWFMQPLDFHVKITKRKFTG